ncbi:MAG TPA: hypothetical protein VH797_09490 [Nitrososphaeraceae archaeon]|jgi:hypothetical protein
MSNQITLAQVRSFLLGEHVIVNESRNKSIANVFFDVYDKAASSNGISIKEARALLTGFY